MSYQTHDLSEWAAVLSLGTGITFAALVLWLLLVDSESARDFDPRPAVRRSLASDRMVPLWQAVVDAGHSVNRALASGLRLGHGAVVRARLTVAAALLALALRLNAPASAPKGATHA